MSQHGAGGMVRARGPMEATRMLLARVGMLEGRGMPA